MKRRRFLKFSALGTLCAGLGLAWFASRDTNGQEFIRAILQKRLGHKLTLDAAGIDRFVDTYEDEIARQGGIKFKVLAGLYPAYVHTRLFEMPLTRDALWWIERDIIANFLMGSGFFHDVASYEAGEPLVFEAHYDVLEQPCSNPFGTLS